MEIRLEKRPKQGAIIIEGFPGLGLVGAIAAEFLINHLSAKKIGSFYSQKIPSIVGVHKGEIMEPLSIFYDEKNNIVIIRSLALVQGLENEISEATLELAKMIKASEIIDIEGVESASAKPEALYYTTDSKKIKKFEKIGIKKLTEGIVFGATASLLTKVPNESFIFAETHSELPDSRAAAKLIEVIDKYLDINVDYKPLIQKAEMFEKKLKEFMSHAEEKVKEKKDTYLG